MAKVRHIPERSCVTCGRKFPKGDLIRIVRTPRGNVTVDRMGKEAGRGAYLCLTDSCWRSAIDKGTLERSLKLSLTTEDRAQLQAFYAQELGGQQTKEQ